MFILSVFLNLPHSLYASKVLGPHVYMYGAASYRPWQHIGIASDSSVDRQIWSNVRLHRIHVTGYRAALKNETTCYYTPCRWFDLSVKAHPTTSGYSWLWLSTYGTLFTAYSQTSLLITMIINFNYRDPTFCRVSVTEPISLFTLIIVYGYTHAE